MARRKVHRVSLAGLLLAALRVLEQLLRVASRALGLLPATRQCSAVSTVIEEGKWMMLVRRPAHHLRKILTRVGVMARMWEPSRGIKRRISLGMTSGAKATILGEAGHRALVEMRVVVEVG